MSQPNKEEFKRKKTLEKKSESLLKKMQELCTLCDTDAVVIIQDVKSNEEYAWPSAEKAGETLEEIQKILIAPVGAAGRSLKMATQVEYLEDKKKGINEELVNMEASNYKTQMKNLMHELAYGNVSVENLDLIQVTGLVDFVEKKLEELLNKRGTIENQSHIDLPVPEATFAAGNEAGTSATFVAGNVAGPTTGLGHVECDCGCEGY